MINRNFFLIGQSTTVLSSFPSLELVLLQSSPVVSEDSTTSMVKSGVITPVHLLEPPQQRSPAARGFVEMPRIPPRQEHVEWHDGQEEQGVLIR